MPYGVWDGVLSLFPSMLASFLIGVAERKLSTLALPCLVSKSASRGTPAALLSDGLKSVLFATDLRLIWSYWA